MFKERVFKSYRVDNVYMHLDDVSNSGSKCLVTQSEESWLWHKCLGHAHFDLINMMSTNNIVIGLPKIKFSKDKLNDACQMRKQTRVSFIWKIMLPHPDLFKFSIQI